MLPEIMSRKRNGSPIHWVLILVGAIILLISLSAYASTGSSEHGDSTLAGLSPSLKELDQLANGVTLKVMVVLLQIAIVLAAAKLCGAIAEAVNIPGVLGEVGAGMLIGPFALGAYLLIPIHGHWLPLFPPPPIVDTGRPVWPTSQELWMMAQLGSVVLLFVVGLHTNLEQFRRFVGPATIVAIGGVVVPFFFGAWATAYFMDEPWTSGQALFVGAVMVATSVGITARVLSDLRKLDTPEGTTIIAAAVVDDVLGILVLAIVAAIARAEVSLNQILWIAVKAIGFWIALTGIGFLVANRIEALFNSIRYSGARLGLALALCLICSGIAEVFGLAFIIGAYSIGLALSRTRMAHRLLEDLEPINDFIVPIFFAAMGMLVDFRAMGGTIEFSIVICVLAIIGKVLGCGLPAWGTGFNLIGAFRVGIGMLPRGEVALIMAGVGLAGGIITPSMFGVAILMTLVTTVIAPLVLVPAFNRGGSGLRRGEEAIGPPEKTLTLTMPQGIAEAFVRVLLSTADESGYEISLDQAGEGIYLLEKNSDFLTITLDGDNLVVHARGEKASDLEQIVADAERRLVTTCDRVYPAQHLLNRRAQNNSE